MEALPVIMSLPEMILRMMLSKLVGMKNMSVRLLFVVFLLVASSVAAVAQKAGLPYIDGKALPMLSGINGEQ